MSKIIRFSEEPTEVRFSEAICGSPIETKFGKEFMHRVNKQADFDQIIYLTPPQQKALIESGATEGDLVTITKRSGRLQFEIIAERKPAPAQTQRPPATPASQYEPQQQAKAMAAALCAAMEAVTIATDYATRQGYSARFDSGDIRSLAITIYIEQSKHHANSNGNWRAA